MGSNKRGKKSARKQAAKIPAWLFDKDVSVLLKREVEDALARHAADNGIAVGAAKFRALTLQDICPSLRLVNAARWSAVGPEMIHAATQPAMKALAAHLQDCKKRRKMMEQLVADLAAAGDGSQSGQGSAEEGEEEEAQADDSSTSRGQDQVMDGEHAYAAGNPHELIQKTDVEEGAAADAQRAEPLLAQILRQTEETMLAREAGQRTRLRVTAEDVRHWTDIGERCKRIAYHVQEIDKEEDLLCELIKDTPLKYTWTTERRMQALARQPSCSSEGE